MNRRTSSILSTVISVIVVVVTVALIFAGIQATGSLFEIRDGYHNANLKFSLGDLSTDDTGKGVIVDDPSKLHTPDALVCTGLRVRPSVSPRYQVEIHFYTKDNRYIGYKVFADTFFEIRVGEMPCLKDVKDTDGDGMVDYNLDNSEYAAASFVKDGDAFIQAHQVRFVINPLDNEKDIFTGGVFGLVGLVNRNKFINSLDIEYTDLAVTENAVKVPGVSI